MCKCSFALVFLSACAWTQSLPTGSPQEAVIAVINGRKITISEYKRMLEAQDPKMRSLASSQPKAFLEEYALYETVLAAAEKQGLDQQSPYKEKIAMARRQILAAGMIDETHKNFPVTPEMAKKFYEENSDLYRQAMVKVIFVSKALQMASLSGEKPAQAPTRRRSRRRPKRPPKLLGRRRISLRWRRNFPTIRTHRKRAGSFRIPSGLLRRMCLTISAPLSLPRRREISSVRSSTHRVTTCLRLFQMGWPASTKSKTTSSRI